MGNKTRLPKNGIKPRKLSWPQLNRLADIFAYGPCQSREGDDLLIPTGLVEWYDGDPEYISGTEGAEKKLYEPPFFRVRDCWRTDEEPPAPEINCNAAKLNIRYGSQTTPNYRPESDNQEVE